MIKLTLKSILGHKFRFALTAFAVILGVSFVVASFVLRDGLKGTFNALIEDINADIDVEIRGVVEFAETDFQDDPLIDESIVDLVSNVDGVAEAVGVVGFQGIIPIGPDGEPLESLGPPLFGFTHSDSDLLPTSLVAGAGPGRGEFVMDIDTADDEGFVVGESYDVIFPTGREPFTLTGLILVGRGQRDSRRGYHAIRQRPVQGAHQHRRSCADDLSTGRRQHQLERARSADPNRTSCQRGSRHTRHSHRGGSSRLRSDHRHHRRRAHGLRPRFVAGCFVPDQQHLQHHRRSARERARPAACRRRNDHPRSDNLWSERRS